MDPWHLEEAHGERQLSRPNQDKQLLNNAHSIVSFQMQLSGSSGPMR
jgi:hypothetical protein